MHSSMQLTSVEIGLARVPGGRYLKEGVAVFARLHRIRPFIAAWAIAGALALATAAVTLAETPYPH